MPYRVELASTGRAGCQDATCKKNQVKIEKGALRCGSWVENERITGWRWKHWGCVSGKQLENIRQSIEHPVHEGQYDWDMMDGLQGQDKKDRLPPDEQEKVKRCITQGFIDPEDWNGDPECNVLGKTGIHLTQKQKEKKEAAEAEDEDGDSSKKSKKRSRGNEANAEESEDDAKPAKKKGTKIAKKEEESDDEKPVKSRAKKSVKKEDVESDEVIPAKKQRGKKGAVKEESDDEVEKTAVHIKRGKKTVVKEEASGDEAVPVKKQRGKKAAVKEEASDDKATPVKKQRGNKAAAQKEDASTLIPGISNADLYAEFRSKLDDDDPDDDYENYVRIRKEFPDAKAMGAAMQEFFTFKYGAEVEKDPELIAKVGKIGKIFEEFLKLRSGYGSYEEMHNGMQAQEKTGEKAKQKGRKTKVKDEPVEENGSVEEAPKPTKRARRSSRK